MPIIIYLVISFSVGQGDIMHLHIQEPDLATCNISATWMLNEGLANSATCMKSAVPIMDADDMSTNMESSQLAD